VKTPPRFFLHFAIGWFLLTSTAVQAPRSAPRVLSQYITGTVTLGPTKPAPSLWVIVYEGSSQKGRSLTGDDGKYYLGGLAQKQYRLVVRKQINGPDLYNEQINLPQNTDYNIHLKQ
jgi:hypothetical protein